MYVKNTDEMENSADSDQTVPVGAVWSASALFAQTNMSGYLA